MLSTIGAEHEHHMCGASAQHIKMLYKDHCNGWLDTNKPLIRTMFTRLYALKTERLANYLQKKGGKARTLSRTFPYRNKIQ